MNNNRCVCCGANKKIDLKGERFGRLLVLEKCGKANDRHIIWKCLCDCGKITMVASNSLRGGKTVSCGCYKAESIGLSRLTHGGCVADKHGERLYKVWQEMKRRCNNPTSRSYKWYGAKGVKVCEEWQKDYEAFKKWAYKNGYNEKAEFSKCTIDRIDTFGNYEPKNCRWVDAKTQALNKRRT